MSLGRSLSLLLIILLVGCTGQTTNRHGRDARLDAGRRDTSGSVDTGGSDAAEDVAAPDDATTADAALPDAGSDTGPADAGVQDAAPDARAAKGTPVGTFWNTYYYLATEDAYSGADDTTLYDANCDAIADVPADFADAACIEGSARLEDGTVINYDQPCSCGPCSFCWAAMDPTTHPWGMGSHGNALEPLRSWATDTSEIPYGTVVYVEEWDGVQIPQIGDLGGFVHDGCFRADDVGGGIDGNHFDFFAGTHAMWQALENIFATRTDFSVYVDSPRCAGM